MSHRWRLWRIVLQTDPAPTGLHAADGAFDLAAAGHEVHAVTRESKPRYCALMPAARGRVRNEFGGEREGVPQYAVQEVVRAVGRGGCGRGDRGGVCGLE